MLLKNITISNYRSVESQTISFNRKSSDDSCTYGLIGVNEAGKSSILKAIALVQGVVFPEQKDFRRREQPISVTFVYEIENADEVKLRQFLGESLQEIEQFSDQLHQLRVEYTFSYLNPSQINVAHSVLTDNASYVFLENAMSFEPHRIVFWTAEPRFLINEPIELARFAANPKEVSIPLANCFELAGITNVAERIAQLSGDSTEVEYLQSLLGQCVTDHIKQVWTGHPIEISFLITDGKIHFHVKDVGANGKAKTANQRSDGFRQFVSFLLTVSAQDRNQQLANTLLLLDEPETHLHPQAQEYLLAELGRITSNERNNIVLFATHSNFLIDKKDLTKTFRVEKINDATKLEHLVGTSVSYSGANYEVFGIATSDYHNELYGKLHEDYIAEDEADEKRGGTKYFDKYFFQEVHELSADRPWKELQKQVSLCTYVRNVIHHPEAPRSFTEVELRKSIELMRSIFAKNNNGKPSVMAATPTARTS